MSTNILIKIFIAFLVAGVIAISSGAISKIMVNSDEITDHAAYLDVEIATISNKASGPEDITDMIATADINKGKKLAKACMSCHSLKNDGKNGIGPNLWGVFGRNKAQIEGFSYSKAMKEKDGIWDIENLNKFLYKPKDYIKGTKMTYVGMKKSKDRAALIAYLKTLSD